MFHVILQIAAGFARFPSRGMMLATGVMGLALLTYCGVQSGGNSISVRELSPPTTVPSDDPPGPTAVYDLAAGSQVVLQGATNVCNWSCSSSQARARVMLNADNSALRTLFDKLQAGQISADQLRLSPDRPAIAELSVPVTSLHGDSQGMDRDMRSALKAPQYPLIQYRLEKVEDAQVRQDPITGKPAFVLRVIGVLTVAGVQRTLATDLSIQRDAGQHYLVHAQIPIRMTDFGVTPPTALFDLIRAQDSLSVIFDLDFVRTDDSPGIRPPLR